MSRSARRVYALSLVAGPALFAASSFFWKTDGNYGITGSTLLVIGSIFWINGLNGLFALLECSWPRYAAWGRLAAIYGAVCGGAGFAFQGLFSELFGVSHDASLAALGAHPVVANLIFWTGGPAFPISLVVLGVVVWRSGLAPAWVGATLALGGALFPVARIPRIAMIAHGVDLLMLVPAVYLGVVLLGQQDSVKANTRR